MRGKRRAPRPRIPWRSPWTPLACLAGLLATGAIAVLGGMAKDVVLIVDGRMARGAQLRRLRPRAARRP
ncbi:hypothetical protein ACFSTC_04230 [Nonomuraea ferruginea]